MLIAQQPLKKYKLKHCFFYLITLLWYDYAALIRVLVYAVYVSFAVPGSLFYTVFWKSKGCLKKR